MKSPAITSYKVNLKFLLLFLTSFLFFLFFLLIINVYIDPRGIFGTGKYPILVATARTEKLLLLRAADPKPEALIFGSSHCMRYSPAYVESAAGLKTFNFSVNSGKMEDFLALLNCVIQDIRIQPKLIILGVCPRTFCEIKDEDFDERLLSNATLLNYVPLSPLSKIHKWAALFLKTLNFGYLEDVRKSIKLSRQQNQPMKRYTFEPDGFLALEEAFNKKGEPLQKDAEVTVFSLQRIEYFKTFLDLCRQNHIPLKIVITPYAPEYIRQEELSDGSYGRLHSQLVTLLENHNPDHFFELYDFSHIENYGGVDEFMGAAHPSIYNSTLILKRLFADSPD